MVFAGRLIKEKGADLLIKAMKLLPDYGCLIVGEGPEKASLIKSAPENVKFAGFMNYGYLIATLKSAKVFVLPSRERVSELQPSKLTPAVCLLLL